MVKIEISNSGEVGEDDGLIVAGVELPASESHSYMVQWRVKVAGSLPEDEQECEAGEPGKGFQHRETRGQSPGAQVGCAGVAGDTGCATRSCPVQMCPATLLVPGRPERVLRPWLDQLPSGLQDGIEAVAMDG